MRCIVVITVSLNAQIPTILIRILFNNHSVVCHERLIGHKEGETCPLQKTLTASRIGFFFTLSKLYNFIFNTTIFEHIMITIVKVLTT